MIPLGTWLGRWSEGLRARGSDRRLGCRAWRGAAALGLVLAGCGRAPRPAASGSDPDSIPSAFTPPSAALLWPGATRSFQVTPAGDLYNGAWRVAIAPSADGQLAAPPRSIAYEGRWLPVVRWRRRAGDVTWSFEAVPFPGPGHRDSGLVVSLLARAINDGARPRVARLELALRPPGPDPVFVAHDAPESPRPPLSWGGERAADTVYAWAEGEPKGQIWRTDWRLAPGESREARALLPAYPATARELAAAARAPHDDRVDALRRFWRQTLEPGTHFSLSDPELETALEAARVLLLSCRERHGARWFAIGGPFQYRDVWLRDGARVAEALAVTGHTQVARELAESFLAFRWPIGAFLSQRGQPDGTGQALWTFEQTLLRPAPDDSLERYVTVALEAWRWLEWQREMGRRSSWTFGLMLPYADPRDGELVRAQLVGTDAWAIAGYRATARLLRAANRDAEAVQVELSLARYRQDFAAALARSSSRDVPPSWSGEGRDWGNLAVGWPCGALAVNDSRLAELSRRVWSKAGGPGLVTYGPRDSLHGYVGADLGTWALLAGRRAEAESVLSALLSWRDACGAGGEIYSRQGGYGRNLPPHPTAAAALVALARNCLLYDDGDTLALTLGARERWWRGSHVERAPTRWGTLELEFQHAGDQARWHWTAVPVWTSLTLPPGMVVARRPAAPLVASLGGTVLLAPPGTSNAAVSVTAANR